MHKGIIVLTKAGDREDARKKVINFLEGYEGDVWDWYVIGGRWSGLLNPNRDKFFKKAGKILDPNKRGFISTTDVASKGNEIQKIWEGMGEKSKNPYQRDNFKDQGDEEDILPLVDCLKQVKKYGFNCLKSANEEIKKAESKWGKDQSMRGYCLKIAGNLLQQNFCFDCNVFNVEDDDYSIPKDPVGWFAVVIDIHN